MQKFKTALLAGCLCVLLGCSPRDFLTRRLAADLIVQTEAFKTPQIFWLATGFVSNKEFNSPDSMVLQRQGWIIGAEQKKCPPGIEPPPCWDVELSPLGVQIVRPLISNETERGPFAIEVARRTLDGVSGVSKAGNFGDVEFSWHWAPLNPIGAALYDGSVHYRSTVGFRAYDDGWRIVNSGARSNQSMDEALRNAEPMAP